MRVLLFLLLFPVGASAQSVHPLPEVLHEISGLAVVGPDSIFAINDGGNGALLHVIDASGELRHTYPVPGTHNTDWESLARDDRGRLYLCDTGNNRNARRDLRIYRLDPTNRRVDTITFHYPDQTEFPPPRAGWRYDLEGVFWYADSLHLFTKNRIGEGDYTTTYYTIPAQPGEYTAQRRERLLLKKRVVTGAALRPDGREIALLTYDVRRFFWVLPYFRASVFLVPNDGTPLSTDRARRLRLPGLLKRQYEAIDYLDADTLLIGAERSYVLAPRLLRLSVER